MGAESFFLGRVVIMNKDVFKNEYFNLTMTSPTSGRLSVTVPDGDYQILFVVSSVPHFFRGHQTFGYELNIKTKTTSDKILSYRSLAKPSANDVTAEFSISSDEDKVIMENPEDDGQDNDNECVLIEDDDYLNDV